ncbi:MAG TPA: dephospho-CoA kinase [bacterium]|nr:dephospho-CoA kinase [bacterium]HOL46737.1 dephospho-CoA kinase [bacterium]HPQ18173.1 dephospho-CoA kinase [bacterium]
MKVIGITGLMGSGKSEVCKIIKKLYKVPIIYSDKIAKYIYKIDERVKQKIFNKFGKEIKTGENKIDIKRLREIVIKDEKKLDELEQIIHPEIYKKEKEIIKFFKRKKKYKFLVIENAILFKVDSKLCDIIILVKTSEKIRQKRTKKNKKNLFTKRQKNIIINKINFIITNNGSKKELEEKVKKIIEKIK